MNGVIDEKGNTVIRGLTDSEKSFLDQFNSEWVNADFYTMPEIKALNSISEIIATEEYPSLKDLKLYTYFLIVTEFIKDEFFLHDAFQRKQCGSMNNSRNRDILNDALVRNLTLEIQEEIINEEEILEDKEHSNCEYDGWKG